MNWRSNFNESELERIDKICDFKSQIGYEPGSDTDIIARMVSILDNAQELINKKNDPPIAVMTNPNLNQPISYQGPPRISK